MVSKYSNKVKRREDEARSVEKRERRAALEKKSGKKPAAAVQEQSLLAQREILAQRQDHALIQGLIDMLPNAIFDPEKSFDEIHRRIGRLHMKPSADTDAQISNGRFSAHAKKIAGLVEDMATHERPDSLLALIKTSRGILKAHGQEERMFAATGVADGAGFDAKVGVAYDAAKAATAEKVTQELIAKVGRSLQRLPSASDPDVAKTSLLGLLDSLGEQQSRAFPKGVETREAMDAVIDKAHAAGKAAAEEARLEALARDARELFRAFGDRDPWSRSPKLENPDIKLAAIRETVNKVLDGDLTRLASRLDSKQTPEQIEQKLDAKHGAAMDIAADALLNARGLEAPSRNWWAIKPPLDDAKELVAAARDPGEALEKFVDDLKYRYREMKEAERVTMAQIKKDAAENQVVRFALVTQHFAAKGEAHGGMLAKTLKAVEAVGGFEKLGAALGRMQVKAEEWDALKKFLTDVPAPAAAPVVAPAVAPIAVERVVVEPVAAAKTNGHANGGLSNGAHSVAVAAVPAPVPARPPLVPGKFTGKSDWHSFLARMNPTPK